MRVTALILSYLFHPLLFATYLVLLIGWLIPRFMVFNPAALPTFAGLVFVMTFVIPVANLLMFKTFGTVTSLRMQTRRERLFPFTMITLIYAVVAIMFFYKVSQNINFNKLMLIIASMVLTATVATFFQKVSVHSMAVCGLLGILIPLNKAVENGALRVPSIAILVLAGLIMSARLYLNTHTPREVLYGAILGFSVGFLGMIILF